MATKDESVDGGGGIMATPPATSDPPVQSSQTQIGSIEAVPANEPSNHLAPGVEMSTSSPIPFPSSSPPFPPALRSRQSFQHQLVALDTYDSTTEEDDSSHDGGEGEKTTSSFTTHSGHEASFTSGTRYQGAVDRETQIRNEDSVRTSGSSTTHQPNPQTVTSDDEADDLWDYSEKVHQNLRRKRAGRKRKAATPPTEEETIKPKKTAKTARLEASALREEVKFLEKRVDALFAATYKDAQNLAGTASEKRKEKKMKRVTATTVTNLRARVVALCTSVEVCAWEVAKRQKRNCLEESEALHKASIKVGDGDGDGELGASIQAATDLVKMCEEAMEPISELFVQ